MRLVHRSFYWLRLAALSAVVIAIGWAVVQATLHLSLLNVQTGSMQPTFNSGDVLIMQKVAPAQLQPGTIVTYHSPRNAKVLISHRLVEVDATDHTFQTKGDALGRPDPSVSDALLAGRVVAVLPCMGRILDWLQTLPGLVVSIYIPVAVMVWSELRRLECSFKRLKPYYLCRGQVV